MSATEAQLGLASEFELEFELKFEGRVRVRLSSFRVPASGFQFREPFSSSTFEFEFPGSSFRVPVSSTVLEIRFRSLFGCISGPIVGPFWDPGTDGQKEGWGTRILRALAI